MLDRIKSYDCEESLLRLSPFTTGAMVLFCWFLWRALLVAEYQLEEWVIFYVIALLAWQPAAAWLSAGARWVPAAELFFLLHLPYYVFPFLKASHKFAELEVGTRIKVGLIIALFLFSCRVCYRLPQRWRWKWRRSGGQILDRMLTLDWRNQIAWIGVVAWCVLTVALQQHFFPNLGSYFGSARQLALSAGTIGAFVLFYEMGCRRLDKRSRFWLVAITALTVLFQLISAFLIGAAVQILIGIFGHFLGSKRVPVVALLVSAAVLAFLHVGKMDIRDRIWDEGKNYSSVARNPLTVLRLWIGDSWNRIMSSNPDEEVPSLIERGNLLNYVSLVAKETPEFLPYMNGRTYAQTALIFVPRFFWPDKPRASLPNETLSIYYGVQTPDSVEVTAVGLGRISEGWANFGWIGVFLSGALIGLILQIPTRLSAGFTPLHVRFLLSVPFIAFGMALEECFGPGLHALSGSLLLTFAVLWVVSVPRAARAVANLSPAPAPATRDAPVGKP